MNASYVDAGYLCHRPCEHQGEIGIMRMMFTTALCCHIDLNIFNIPYEYRYCYSNYGDAMHAFKTWNGEGHPPGPWIKRKGADGDLPNPYLTEMDE